MLRKQNNLKSKQNWKKDQLLRINRYKQQIQDIEKENLLKKIINKNSNTIEFYKILPKQELPKSLQKLKFQTLHLKENQLSTTIQVQRRQFQKPQEIKIRKKLKQQGYLLFLSEIYHSLGQNKDLQKITPCSLLSQIDLQKWQKINKIKSPFWNQKVMRQNRRVSKITKQQSLKVKDKQLFTLLKENQNGNTDYINYIQKGLEIIAVTHSTQLNFINKFALIQNSSKLLKKQLDCKGQKIRKEINNKLKILEQYRKQHHKLFLERSELQRGQKQFIKELIKQQTQSKAVRSHSYLPKLDKIQDTKAQRRLIYEKNQTDITSIKKKIESLEMDIQKLKDQQKNILAAQDQFYILSLKNGIDCRQNGLGWILKSLKQKYQNLEILEFPSYLDKKSKNFLIFKSQTQQILQNLLDQKQAFINQIGKKPENKNDQIIQGSFKDLTDAGKVFQVPPKYRRSKKKITLLGQEYIRNQSLIQHSQRKGFQISSQIQGKTGKQIYSMTREKIKKMDLMKIKKQKNNLINSKLIKYQNLLQKIKDIHIKLQEEDIQQETHLLSHYKDTKDSFFLQSTACFGYKKAYALIIKNFSLKNAFTDV